MRFAKVDNLLGRQIAGEFRSPAAEHLGMALTVFARGVAVYEMPVERRTCGALERVDSHVVTALAEEAMTAAAISALSDDHDPDEGVAMRDLRARFDRAVGLCEATSLRAEAIVVRVAGRSVHVVADVLCEGERIAAFECECERPEARPLLRAVA